MSVVAVSCLIASPAIAQPTREPETPTHSYATRTLAVDALAAAMVIGAEVGEKDGGRDTELTDALAVASLPLAYLGAPIVHGLRGNWASATASLATRFGASLLGATAGLALAESCESSCRDDGAIYGALAGLAVASVIDATMLTREPVATDDPIVTPSLAVGREGATVGLGGAF